jgi:hypothetical protein
MCQLLGMQPGSHSSSQQQHNPLRYDLTELSGVLQHGLQSFTHARNRCRCNIGVCQAGQSTEWNAAGGHARQLQAPRIHHELCLLKQLLSCTCLAANT